MKIKWLVVVGVVLVVLVAGWRWYRMANPPEGGGKEVDPPSALVGASEAFATALEAGDVEELARQEGVEVDQDLRQLVDRFGNRPIRVVRYSSGFDFPNPGWASAVMEVECSQGVVNPLRQVFEFELTWLVFDKWVPMPGEARSTKEGTLGYCTGG